MLMPDGDDYRTCPQCGLDCEPVPFDSAGAAIRVSFTCSAHGAHTVVDPFADTREIRE